MVNAQLIVCSEPGVSLPVVKAHRCWGKGDCVDVCPYDVFEMQRLTDEELDRHSLLGRIKLRMHDRIIASTPRADRCRGCGLCVSVCDGGAIALRSA